MNGAPTITDTDFDSLGSAGDTGPRPISAGVAEEVDGPDLDPPVAAPSNGTASGRRLLIISALAFVVAFALANGALFVRAQGSPARAADVVVVLNGGDGERLAAGLDIVDRGAAPTLVVSHGLGGEWVPAERVCTLDRSIDVQCPSPDTLTTRGEAEMMADLVALNGWERVDVVTSSYHGPRARILFNRCIEDAEIHVVSVRPSIGPGSWAKRLVHEWGGIVQAMGESTCE